MRTLLLAGLAGLIALGAGNVDARKSGAPAAPGGVEISAGPKRPVQVKAYGYADLEQSVRMRPDAVFRIASLTKQFTAVAILRLVEDGRLSLDDKLTQRLPDCPSSWRDITLRQLLSQTSGLSGDLAPLLAHIHDDLAPRELVDLYTNLPVRAAPGESWAYANLNYWILGLVIEAAAGEPYNSFVDRRVLAPAHLAHTRIGDSAAIIARRVRGYEPVEGGGFVNARYFSSTLGYAAGGYVSSAQDIVRWYDALARGRIISPATLAAALTPTPLNNGETAPYGLGWYVATIDGHPVAHHGGSTFGFRSYVYWRPGTGAVAAVFLNSSGDEPEAEARALLRPHQK